MAKTTTKSSKAVGTPATGGSKGSSSGILAWFSGGGLEWVKSLAIAIGVALAIRWVFAEPFRIPSGSMEPTLHGDDRILRGDRVFVNKWIFGLRYPLNGCRIPFTHYRIEYAKDRLWRRAAPKRWDIVVFKSAEPDAWNTTLVKRVVGLPGERIQIRGGKVYANGQELVLPPGMPPVEYTTDGRGYGVQPDENLAVVPKDCYLVLGDNSDESRDGRYFGWLPYERIMGRVSCIWWPPTRWRDFTGFSKTLWWRAIVTVVSVLLFVRLFLGRSWRQHFEDTGGKLRADHYYVNRCAFGLPVPFTRLRLLQWGTPRRGQLVLYRRPAPGKKADADEVPDLLLGRVAGLPGERVFLDNGKLQIDGQLPQEPSCLAGREYVSGEGVGPYGRSKGREYSLVPENAYFILAESSIQEDHWDSRTVGWVPRPALIGVATAVWWPPRRWRRTRA